MLSVKTFKKFNFAIRQVTFFSYFYIKHLKYIKLLPWQLSPNFSNVQIQGYFHLNLQLIAA